MILDDSASALDFATDSRLRRALLEDTPGMTVFIVSQRAASIMYADKIIVLEDGRIAGFGTHEELMASCGVYQEICYSQLKNVFIVFWNKKLYSSHRYIRLAHTFTALGTAVHLLTEREMTRGCLLYTSRSRGAVAG